MRFRCPKCSGLFELDAIPAEGLARCPTCLDIVRVGGVRSAGNASGQVELPTTPLPPDPDFRSIPSVQFQPHTLPAYLTQPPPPPPSEPFRSPLADYTGPPRRKHRKRSSTETNSGVKIVLWLVGGMMAMFFGLIVLGGVGYYVMTQTSLLHARMELAGYTTSAPGRLVPNAPQRAGQEEVGVLHRRTGSQFQMIFVQGAATRVDVSPELFLTGLATRAKIAERTAVTRSGLQGFHFRTQGMLGGTDMEGEVFSVPGGLLIISYQSGNDLASRRGTPAKASREEERRIDNPEAFFASLKPR